jgi:Flp pilus assembly protein TadG
MICLTGRGKHAGIFPQATEREKGAELAEFAVVFPLFLALLFALIWCGRALSIYGTITRAAREGTRFALAPSCASCAPANTLPTDPEVANVVSGSSQAAGMDPNSIKTYSPPGTVTFCATGIATGCTTTKNIQICRGVQLNSSTPPQQCGIVVSYAYPVPLTFSMQTELGPLLKIPPITVATSVQMTEE